LGSLNLPFFANTDNKQDLPASYFVVAAGSVLSFWHNVLMQSTGYFNYCLNIYWSLSVEEVFYLAMPLLCISLRKRWMLLIVCLGLIVYGPIYRSQHLGNEIFYMYGYFACFDAIAIGCLTALLSRQVRITQPVAALLRVIAGIALCVVYLRGIAGNEIFGFSLIALCSALFLFGSSAVDASTGKTSKWDISAAKLTSPLRWLGRHSYELYLFHIIVLAAMRNLLDKTELSYWARLPWLMLFLLLSAILAALVARYVSEPANRAIRQRWLRPSAKLAVS
jgi:peptidoglycan/LPS O-acetylase OafA/YrhL